MTIIGKKTGWFKEIFIIVKQHINPRKEIPIIKWKHKSVHTCGFWSNNAFKSDLFSAFQRFLDAIVGPKCLIL
jgi:hypothetical protein